MISRLVMTTREFAETKFLTTKTDYSDFSVFFLRVAVFMVGHNEAIETLNKAMLGWCEENVDDGDWETVEFENALGIIMFKHETHALLFKMRFG
jgi:hypothetical protein